MSDRLTEPEAWREIARRIAEGEWVGSGLCAEIEVLHDKRRISIWRMLDIEKRIERHLSSGMWAYPHRAIQMAEAPSKLALRVYGSLKIAGRALGVAPRSFFNWDRTMRLPFRIWQHMLEVDRLTVQPAAISERPIVLRQPYRLRPMAERKTRPTHPTISPPPPTKADETPTERTTRVSLMTRVTQLEQENTVLRQRFTAVCHALWLSTMPGSGAGYPDP